MAEKNKQLSWVMRFVRRIAFWVKNRFYIYSDIEQKMLKYSQKLKRTSPRRRIPKWVHFYFKVTTKKYLGSDCYFLEPKKKQSEKYLVYFHGGAYYLPILRIEWNFIATLAKATNATACVPMYPLAPEFNASFTPPFLKVVYQDLVASNKSNLPISLVGTSAGGGIALAFAQMIRNEHLPRAQKVILLSPSVDMTPLSEHEQQLANEIDQVDCVLSTKLVNVIVKWWCPNHDYRYYFVSPIYGGLADLGEIWVFTSTCDLLNIVAHRLQKQAASENVVINYIERDLLPHVWMVFLRTKEARDELKNIAAIINDVGVED